MKIKILIPSILFVFVVIIALIAFSKPAPNSENSAVFTEESTAPSGIVLYYGIGCPFCEQIDAYIEEKGIDEVVTFEHKEIYYDRDNASELALVASVCEPPLDNIGVPFLWDGENCFIGMPDIVNFFDQKVIDNENE